MANEVDRPLARYEVLLCATGGIACYKAAELTSLLVQAGAGVSVAMTEAAQRFVAPLTFQTLSRREVYTSLWTSDHHWNVRHIALTELADLLIVAPATADVIAKIAVGLADDLVSALALSANQACPILLAPAMNSRMWQAPPVQENVHKLNSRGVVITGPEEGYLACGTIGPGRMSEPDVIYQAAADRLLKAPPKKSG